MSEHTCENCGSEKVPVLQCPGCNDPECDWKIPVSMDSIGAVTGLEGRLSCSNCALELEITDLANLIESQRTIN